MSNEIIINNAEIYSEEGRIEQGYIVIDNGKIVNIEQGSFDTMAGSEKVSVIDGTGLTVIPGFIDTHIHGANSADVMDATESALDKIASVIPHEETISFLVTTMTNSEENIEKALANVATYPNKQGYAEVLGVHLEGPFINIDKK